jgi:hypothetical protein
MIATKLAPIGLPPWANEALRAAIAAIASKPSHWLGRDFNKNTTSIGPAGQINAMFPACPVRPIAANAAAK